GAQAVKVGFATTGGAGRANLAVDIQPRAEDRRIADPSRNLPRQPTRRRHTADVASAVDAVAVDRAPVVFGIDEAFARHLQPGVVPGFGTLFRVEIMIGINSTLPLQPQAARSLRVEIVLDREPHVACEVLRTLADDQMMVG